MCVCVCVYVGGGVAQCMDLTDSCRPEKQGLDWGRGKGIMFFATTRPAAVTHPACYPAVTDGCHTGNQRPVLEADVSTAYSTDVS